MKALTSQCLEFLPQDQHDKLKQPCFDPQHWYLKAYEHCTKIPTAAYPATALRRRKACCTTDRLSFSTVQAVNVANQAGDSSATSHPPTEPPAPKERALMPAGMDKHAKKAHWDQRKAERARARQVSTACHSAHAK